MRITNNVYQLTGHINGLNANTFAIDTPKGLVLIDTGYREYYREAMRHMLRLWGLETRPVAAAFITHAHFDHAGNAHLFEEDGVPIYISEADSDAIQSGGDRVMESVFGSRFYPCEKTVPLKDGDTVKFGSVTVQAISLPGHTAGSMGFLVEMDENRILFTGDLFIISGTSPGDELELEIGYTGSVDYDPRSNLESFRKLRGMKADIIAGGHRGVYYGDSVALFERLYALAEREIFPALSERYL